MPQVPVNEEPGFSLISFPGSKCVRRAGHRFDGKTATADGGKRVAAKEHQVGVALVDPERDFRSTVQISELHTSKALLVPTGICRE
jgi:hypothetical protein